MLFSSVIYITLQWIVTDLEVLDSSFQLMILLFYLMFSEIESINLFGLASSIVSLFYPLDFYERMLFHSYLLNTSLIYFQRLCYVFILNELARELSS